MELSPISEYSADLASSSNLSAAKHEFHSSNLTSLEYLDIIQKKADALIRKMTHELSTNVDGIDSLDQICELNTKPKVVNEQIKNLNKKIFILQCILGFMVFCTLIFVLSNIKLVKSIS